MKKILFFRAFLYLLVSHMTVIAAFSQNAVQIDVTSLTISKPYISSAQITLTANNLPQPYQSPLTGNGGGVLFSLEGCRPCYLGASLPTSFGWDAGNFFSGFNISGYGNDKLVRFYLTGTSPPASLSPAIRLKDRDVTLTGAANILGKLEIYAGNTLIAYDNEVNLTGVFKAEFGQYRTTNSRRAFDFRSVEFSYSQ